MLVDKLRDKWFYNGGMTTGAGAPCLWSDTGRYSNRGLLIEEPIENFIDPPDLAAKAAAKPLAATQDGQLRLFNSADAHIEVRAANGQTVGYEDGIITGTFEEAFPYLPRTGFPHPPIGYFLPAAATYSIELWAHQDAQADLSVFGPEQILVYSRSDAAGDQRDRVHFDGGLVVTNPDALTRTVRLKTLALDRLRTRIFEVVDLAIAGGDSVRLSLEQQTKLQLVNYGGPTAYSLLRKDTSPEGVYRYRHEAVELPAGASHRIEPNWEDPQAPVPIRIDLDSDGTIDGDMQLSNLDTHVEETQASAVPAAFELAQNQPNPFNSSTTIGFALPVAGRVGLAVFNLAGQQVATLVDGFREAGTYTMAWDGRDDQERVLASSVYLYRLRAGDQVQTRKLLLMR